MFLSLFFFFFTGCWISTCSEWRRVMILRGSESHRGSASREWSLWMRSSTSTKNGVNVSFFFLLFSSLLGASIQFCLMGRSASVYPQKISHSISCVTYGRFFSSLSSDNRAGLRCTLNISAAIFGGGEQQVSLKLISSDRKSTRLTRRLLKRKWYYTH